MPQTVAAKRPVAGEFARGRIQRPITARTAEPQSIARFEMRWAIGPAKWRNTNIMAET